MCLKPMNSLWLTPGLWTRLVDPFGGKACQLLSSSVSVSDEDDRKGLSEAGQTFPTARCGGGGFDQLLPSDSVGSSWSGCNKVDRE